MKKVKYNTCVLVVFVLCGLDYEEFKEVPKFKTFIDEFRAALSSFDKAKEWADLIKCLQRIAKVLSRYPKFPIVPEKFLVAKRLAQCSNPSLPSGVHLKTVETYALLCQRLGPDRLANDLPLYSTGLFTLYQHAATNVKVFLLILTRLDNFSFFCCLIHLFSSQSFSFSFSHILLFL
jgi:hypothetical protein